MATWGEDALRHEGELIALVAGGLGFGLAIAPVNAALLNHTDDDVHGVASGMLIVARMVGMLVGISALTTVGLRAFYRRCRTIPPIHGALRRARRPARPTTKPSAPPGSLSCTRSSSAQPCAPAAGCGARAGR